MVNASSSAIIDLIVPSPLPYKVVPRPHGPKRSHCCFLCWCGCAETRNARRNLEDQSAASVGCSSSLLATLCFLDKSRQASTSLVSRESSSGVAPHSSELIRQPDNIEQGGGRREETSSRDTNKEDKVTGRANGIGHGHINVQLLAPPPSHHHHHHLLSHSIYSCQPINHTLNHSRHHQIPLAPTCLLSRDQLPSPRISHVRTRGVASLLEHSPT